MKALQANRINYLKKLKMDPLQDQKNQRRIKLILPLAVVVAFIAVFSFISLYKLYFVYYPELAELQSYTEDTEVVAKYHATTILQSKYSALVAKRDNLTAVKSAVASYPDLTKSLYNTVVRAAGSRVSLDKFTYVRTTGELMLDCSAEMETYAPDFVQKLRDSGEFKQLNYYGYDQEVINSVEDENTTQYYKYSFTVICTLNTPNTVNAEQGGASNE